MKWEDHQIGIIKNKIFQHTLLLLCLLISINSFSQKSFRRHFIIAYDVSRPFIVAENNTPTYSQALIDLFSNKQVYGFNEANQDNLIIEKRNGLIFFDPKLDEISFFHFNVAGSEFDKLRQSARTKEEKGIVSDFNKEFIKDKDFTWSAFSDTGNITEYLSRALIIRPNPTNFANGVSMSNFVFPLVLNQMDPSEYSEEYVLIILSDFKTGSMLGNTEDTG